MFEALSCGEGCFLGDEEWRSILPDTLREDQRKGRASHLGELIDRAFSEVARGPGISRQRQSSGQFSYHGRCHETAAGPSHRGLPNSTGRSGNAAVRGNLPSGICRRYFRPGHGAVGPVLLRRGPSGSRSAPAIAGSSRAQYFPRNSHSSTFGSDDPWDKFQNQTAMMLLVRERRSLQPARPQGHRNQAETWFGRVSMSMGMMLSENAPM